MTGIRKRVISRSLAAHEELHEPAVSLIPRPRSQVPRQLRCPIGVLEDFCIGVDPKANFKVLPTFVHVINVALNFIELGIVGVDALVFGRQMGRDKTQMCSAPL